MGHSSIALWTWDFNPDGVLGEQETRKWSMFNVQLSFKVRASRGSIYLRSDSREARTLNDN